MIKRKMAAAATQAVPPQKPPSPKRKIVGTPGGQASRRKPVSKKREQTTFLDEQPAETRRGQKTCAKPVDMPKPADLRASGQASLLEMLRSATWKLYSALVPQDT